MEKIYVVMCHFYSEVYADEICGIFSTKELAEEYLAKDISGVTHTIYEEIIDEETK